MSFLVEQAGGLALTGKNRIMDINPQTVHQRVPCILGSPEDVAEMQRYYEASDDAELHARCEARVKGMSTTTTDTAGTTVSMSHYEVEIDTFKEE